MAHGHGGTRKGAGRKASWQHGDTQTIRVPVALADQVLTYARQLDAGTLNPTQNQGPLLVDVYASDLDDTRRVGRAIAQLQMELERLAESKSAKPKRELLQHVLGILEGRA
jgi:hypothetical protein